MALQVVVRKFANQIERKTRTTMDTLEITKKLLESWKAPPFQRPLRVNDKVRALAEELKSEGGVLPGIITLGVFEGTTYLIDGQHRKEAFLISGIEIGYVDVRVHHFETMADMGIEFTKLNGRLVAMRPDDYLRAMEGSLPHLAQIRKRCPFVGYDFIRRGPAAPLVSMSCVVRWWKCSATDIPTSSPSGMSAQDVAMTMTSDDTEQICAFLSDANAAFGRDAEYSRLWSGLNMILCMWIYRRVVMERYSARTAKMDHSVFRKCLMSLSAESKYMDWLVGRQLCDRDRSPAYGRIKAVFAARMKQEGLAGVLPGPEWAHGIHHS